MSVFEKTCATTQKSKKSCFWNLKKTLKSKYSFRGHLITLVFRTQSLKVSTGKSPTSNIVAQKCGRSVHIHQKLCNLELRVINTYKSSNTLD